MTSVLATSPSLTGNAFVDGDAKSLSSRRSSGHSVQFGTSPPNSRKAATSPKRSNPHGHAGHVHLSPLHLPRGHDSSDVAALSSSLREGGASSMHSLFEEAQSSASTIAAASHKEQDLPSTSKIEAETEPMGPFEGPEKLLELWFADSIDDVPGNGLLNVQRQVWEDMLDIVNCKVLSVVSGHNVDAFLLSESSMFVFPHKLILKTCGTTTLLLGLERLLSIAIDALKFANLQIPGQLSRRQLGAFVKRCFYSRKSFMFPERQKGPHRDWTLEVALLDEFFEGGSAYTVGKMNGNHWLLYLTTPMQAQQQQQQQRRISSIPPAKSKPPADETIEILMTHLSPSSCSRFEFPTADTAASTNADHDEHTRGHTLGSQVCASLQLAQLFPNTTVDAFAFEPCGFSANAIIGRERHDEDGYWTVHVTPEEDCSYASFESNVVQSAGDKSKDLAWLVQRILSIFEPAKLSVTLFTSNTEGVMAASQNGQLTRGDVLHSLQLANYKRTDRIAYEFDDYDLVFVSFDKIDQDAAGHAR